MGDMGDIYRDMKSFKQAVRARYGVPCPECIRKQPKRNPTILLPSQRCRVDGYIDSRQELTPEQEQDAWNLFEQEN